MVLLKYTVDVQNGWNNIVVNLPVGLTIQQRKLHRSCLNYKINGGYVYDTNNNVKVKFGTLPNTWPVRASIKRARNHWLKMHKELLTNNPSLKPKWHDYKMAAFQQQMLPTSNSGYYTTYNVPEDIFDQDIPHETKGITWSVFTTENSATRTLAGGGGVNVEKSDKDEFTAHVLGAHLTGQVQGESDQYESIGALQSWIRSRPDLEPVTTVSDSELDGMQNDPLNMLFNDGGADNELVENFHNSEDGDGDQEGDAYPAYDLINPVNVPMEVAAAATTSATPISYFTGFEALLGQVLLRIDATVTSGTAKVDLIFDVDPRGMTI